MDAFVLATPPSSDGRMRASDSAPAVSRPAAAPGSAPRPAPGPALIAPRSLAGPAPITYHATADGRIQTAVFHLMSMPFTLRLLTAEKGVLERCANEVRALLARVDARLSPFRADSLVSRFRRGDRGVLLTEADVYEVYALCEHARDVTHGHFDALDGPDWDPTGLVKGWAVERAFERALAPLLQTGAAEAAALSGGGDMRLGVRAGSTFLWGVGIESPDAQARSRGELVGTVRVGDGAVATSGTSKRGEHLRRRGGRRPDSDDDVVQATVVSPSLMEADIWATAAISAGVREFSRLASAYAPVQAALLVSRDGAARAVGVVPDEAAHTSVATSEASRMTCSLSETSRAVRASSDAPCRSPRR